MCMSRKDELGIWKNVFWQPIKDSIGYVRYHDCEAVFCVNDGIVACLENISWIGEGYVGEMKNVVRQQFESCVGIVMGELVEMNNFSVLSVVPVTKH